MDYLILFSATVIAVLAVELFGKNIKKTSLDLLSGFTGAFVIGILVFHMFSEVYSELNARTVGLCILLGLIIQTVLDFYTKGIDHGHNHTDHCTHSHDHSRAHTALTVGMFVSLSLHTFIESLPILSGGHMHVHGDHHGIEIAGISPLLAGIALHTIPMAIVLYIFILKALKRKIKAMLLIFLFGLSGPLGMFVGESVPLLGEYYFEMLAVVIGILLHVSAVMLFDCDMTSGGKLKKLSVIVVGMILAMLFTIGF